MSEVFYVVPEEQHNALVDILRSTLADAQAVGNTVGEVVLDDEPIQRRDDALLIAAGVTVHQHPFLVSVPDREAGRAVVMGRASRRPAAAGGSMAVCLS